MNPEILVKFKKSSRLLTDYEFTAVFASAHEPRNRKKNILNTGPYTIYVRASDEAPRLGLSIGRKTVRRAHDRNKIKRCLREFFRRNRKDLQGDIVVKVQRLPEKFTYELLTQPLSALTKD